MGFETPRSPGLEGRVTHRRTELGIAMFLIAEAVFFFLLMLAFVYFRTPGAGKLNLGAGALDTACLLASIFTIWRATAGSRLWLSATILFGALFLAGQVIQYLQLMYDGVTISQGLFGTTFFTLAGVHGLHVLVGLIALAIVPAAAIRTTALYWYFVAGVWLAIFLVAYVGGPS
jgi:heme/copper-type cytochrome/quinol oxidase subunit 3